LIDLAPTWGRALPNALFVAPHAPEAYDQAPFGRQWFSLADRRPAVLEAGVRVARDALEAFLAAETTRLGLTGADLALMGFSQGAMTALFTGLRRATPPAAILAFAGALLAPEALAAEITARPPVLLVHGEADEVVPAAASRAAESALQRAGIAVESLYRPGLAHGIDDAGTALGALFLQRTFSRSEGK
jgi:phospholipase/carboxylesterase